MSSQTTILRTVMATAIFATLSLGAARANDNGYFRGWQLTSIQYAPAPQRAARRPAPSQEQWGGWASWGGSSSSSSAPNLDEEIRHVDEMNQMFHDDAVNLGTAEANAANAAAAQAQNDLINATVGPQ